MKIKAVCDVCHIRYEWTDKDCKSAETKWGASKIAVDALHCIICDGSLETRTRQNYLLIVPGDIGLMNMSPRREWVKTTHTTEKQNVIELESVRDKEPQRDLFSHA